MKKLISFVSAFAVLAISNASLAAERIGDFSLLDHNGTYHSMSWYDDHKAIAFLVQSNGSTTTADAIASFKAMKAEYDAQGIEFMMINSSGTQNRDSITEAVAAFDTDIPVLIDYNQLIGEAMGIDKVGEVLVYDPKSFTVVYRGPSAQPLDSALQEIVAGKAVSSPMVAANGEAISYPAKVMHANNGISYTNDVAPILAEKCAACHRQGGIAPFAMDSYAMVQGWSPMIREVIMTKRMPPGQIDPHVGNYINSMTLGDADAQTLLHWIEAGSVKDGDSDPLTQLSWNPSKWEWGEPDHIIKLPPQSVPATGVLDYRMVMVDLELDEDKWLKASQYVAGDRTVLHHTLNGLVEPGKRPGRGGFLGGGDPNQAQITAYIPGAEPKMNPANTGGLIKAGSKIALQLHYTTSGKETVDNSEIGLWFYDENEVPEERMSGQCACIFTPTWTNIPPNDPNYVMEQTVTIERDAYMMSMTPHMHFRGKWMKFTAHYPDGTQEELINIANYNYAWQLAYTMKEPKLMPAGTKVVATGAFDNSSQNAANPDPSRSVPWGQQSWDEMFFGAMSWKYADQGGN